MYNKRTKSAESKAKSKFRQSAKWKKFRMFMKKLSDNKDALTGKPLYKGFQVHHLDMSSEHYENLIPENFLCLNRNSHEIIHDIFRYYQKDKEILKRLEIIMQRMDELN